MSKKKFVLPSTNSVFSSNTCISPEAQRKQTKEAMLVSDLASFKRQIYVSVRNTSKFCRHDRKLKNDTVSIRVLASTNQSFNYPNVLRLHDTVAVKLSASVTDNRWAC
ncbi:uncharacterized protein BJ212DRAFT_1489170 [Suillus subaureus]|uniref:Uncharacterized protein n=1 Tax=Suillus subaureus TaxID=48587 RepID=A0A9P7IXV7_9AGAM|nr:uncharacterized protein BJ212DRAFT_1489170 [Suillus subaureus]KAG1796871.1 hypothetical protein BJ212DRAFT_1489170 [Suillus subaureus]